MISFLDNVVTYISSVSSSGAYGTLSRLAFSKTPEVQTALLGDDGKSGSTPLRGGQLQILVRGTQVRSVLARAETLHALFDNTWVTTCGLSARFTADHGVQPPFQSVAGFPTCSLNYHFTTTRPRSDL